MPIPFKISRIRYDIATIREERTAVEERKKKHIRVKDLVIYADHVQIVNREKGHEHEHREDISPAENEQNRRGPWDWILGGRQEEQ